MDETNKVDGRADEGRRILEKRTSEYGSQSVIVRRSFMCFQARVSWVFGYIVELNQKMQNSTCEKRDGLNLTRNGKRNSNSFTPANEFAKRTLTHGTWRQWLDLS